MNEVDVTLSVLIDNAALEYHETTKRIIDEIGLPVDMLEVALEKELYELKNKKMTLYATAIYGNFPKRKVGDAENVN